jgi:hypothetical protein
MAKSSREAFYQVITAAINDLLEHGYDSQQRLDQWFQRINQAARQSLIPESVLNRSLQDMLLKVFNRTVGGEALLKRHPGVSQFTLQSVKPKLRAELDRRILASANLIKLNREAAIQQTLQRVAAWATSIPIGGTEVAKRAEIKKTVRRGIAGLGFRERRVIVDQGHKLAAAINEIVAVDGGAIAGEWHHVIEGPPSYDSRPDHVARNKKVYLIRGSWAHKEKLVKPGPAGHTDQITAPGEEVYCSCWYTFLYNLRDLPTAMLTKKGAEKLAEVRAQIRRLDHAAHV